jgi:metal-sulfur cluster biosynthetic enzyme
MNNVKTNNDIKCTLALGALESVMDPEIGLNVVDLGLIYEIEFDEENLSLKCTMTLTTQFCPMGEAITDGVKEALQQAYPGYAPEVHLTFEPAWNYDMISEEGRAFLSK